MKKLLSTVICIAFIVALLPSFVYASDNAPESYVYNFRDGLHTDSSGKPAAYITTCDNWICEDSSEGEWTCSNTYYHYGSGTNAAKHSTSYFAFRPKIKSASLKPTYSPGIALDANSQFMSALAIKIEVKKGGIYAPSLTLVTEDSSPEWEIFLTEAKDVISKDTLGAYVSTLDSSDRLGIIDAYGNGEDVRKEFLNRELEAGSYYLIFISNGMNDSCIFTDEGNNVFRVELLLKSFSLRNIDIPISNSNIEYNLTSSALADPSTVSDYCDANVTDSSWHCTNLLKLGYSALAQNENKFAFVGDIYTRQGTLSENGVLAYLWSGRYVYNSSYFSDNDGDGKKETVASGDAYGTSTNIALKINVSEAGKYKLYLANKNSDQYGSLSNVYFVDSAIVSNQYSASNIDKVIEDKDEIYRLKNRFDSAVAHPDGVYLGDVVVSSANNDYYIIFSPDYDTFKINKGTVGIAGRPGFQSLHLSGIVLEPIVEDNAYLKAEKETFNEIEKTKNDEIAKAEASGLSNIATVNILSNEINGDEAFDQSAKKVTGTYGSVITVEAEEKDGYEFLYWAKGIGSKRKAVSDSREYSFRALSGGTWLTAVYKNISSEKVSVVFYNGNGEEVERRMVDSGSEIAVPDLPSLRGYEASVGWALDDSRKLYQPGESIAAKGSQMLFVAQFDDPVAGKISVKANGSDYGKYAYGEKVSVNATERENGNGSKVFVYWKKDGEIVSFNKEYSFLASEDCELEACYESYKPMTEELRKIIINSDGNQLMAEFIGVDSAVEKGIIFGGLTFATATHKIAMTQSGNHLSAVDDVESDTYIGYAILSDGTVIYDK